MSDELLTMVEREVLRWPGVTSEPGRFGATSFRYGKREIGHIHHDRIADLPVTTEMREDILALDRNDDVIDVRRGRQCADDAIKHRAPTNFDQRLVAYPSIDGQRVAADAAPRQNQGRHPARHNCLSCCS